MKLLITMSYLGTNFCGYQVQKNGRTVQGELTTACAELFGYVCDITGCSRTDSGVHANMYCAAVSRHGTDSLETSIDISKIPAALNVRLPGDIYVYGAVWVEDRFHPRYDVKYKEYIYRIYDGGRMIPFEKDRCWISDRHIDDKALCLMDEAAQYFVGKHDFSSSKAQGSGCTECVRQVKYASVYRVGECVIFKVAADGFLYNMVRIMTGTLWSVACGKIVPSDIIGIIDSQDRRRAGITAPPEGLYLNSVVY